MVGIWDDDDVSMLLGVLGMIDSAELWGMLEPNPDGDIVVSKSSEKFSVGI